MMCQTESEEEGSAEGGLGPSVHPHSHGHSHSRSSNALYGSGMVYNKWMMRQSSESSSSSSSEALVQAIELETKFSASLSARGALDPYVHNLCNNIRDLYESIILVDHAFAEAHNVEQSLWHLHYRQIDDFRHRVSSIKGWSASPNGQASSSLSKETWKDLLQKEPVLAGFKSFLVEASGFYHELIAKLRVQCGLSIDLLDGVHYNERKSVELKRCQEACYRCLVNLGDYARYKEFYVGNDPANYDFSIAAAFYRKAISYWPVDGQPHNQLAVLAVNVGDEVLAVYHYFRSLAVQKPFPTTRENLTILFDKNRVKYEQLPAATVETALPLSKLTLRKAPEGVKAIRYRAPKPAKRGATKKLLGELISCFFVRFVRLNGLLFTKTSLEKFEEVFSGALHDLEQLFELDDKNLELALGSGNCIGMGPEIHGAFGALKLVSILICTVENVKWGSRYVEASQRDVLFQYALTAFLGIVGRLMQRCAEADDAFSSTLFPAILVVLEWLACRPEMVQGDAGEEQSNLLRFFWKQCVTLLNRFCDDKCEDAMNDSLEESSLEDCKVGIALWEDFELQGFSPLAPAHATLSYAERPNGNGTEIEKDKHIRLHRLLATGKAIVSMVEGSGMGMLFNEDLGKFHLPGEMLEKKPYDESHGIVGNNICRPVDCSLKTVATKFKEKELAIESSLNKQTWGDDDDGEELIVFQPVLNEQAVVAPRGCCTAASQPSSVSASSFWKGGFSSAPSLTCAVVSSVPEVSKSSSSMKLTRPPNAIPNFGTSLPQVEPCSADSTNLVQLTDLDPKGNPESPLCPQHWLNQTVMPSMQFVNGNASQGFKKATNSLGVIGQPKKLQTCMLETIDNFTSEDLDGSYKLAYENFNGASHYGALPFTLRSSSQKQPPPSLIEKLNEEVQGRIYASTVSKLVESAAARTSAPTKKSPSLTCAVMCPPPGFGPRPMNPLTNKLVLGEGKMSNQQVGNEQPKVDDYFWLDDYKASTPTPNYKEKHQTLPGGSSTYSLWSSSNNKMAQSGGGILSCSPSMQLSHQEEKGNPAAQLQQPLSGDKETWSLFGPTAPVHWTSTIFS